MNIKLSENFTFPKLLKFTFPTIIMMVFTSLYGIVDGLFVSNEVGSDAFTAVNLIMPAIMMLGSVGFMIGTGGSALVSKTLGEKKEELANKYFSLLIYTVIIVGIVISAFGIIFLRPIAKLLGADETILQDCVVYGRIVLLSLTAFFLQNCFQSFLVVAEKPKIGLAFALCAGVTNMVMDYILIYVFKFGIAGAAIATALSEVVGGIRPLLYFLNKKNNSLLHLQKTNFDIKAIMKSCTNGSSEMLSHISMNLVNILYNYELLRYAGKNGVAAYGIIMYINFIFVSIFIGYSIGTAPIVGYNYGANNKKQLQNIFKKSMTLITISAIVMFAIAELSANELSHVFVGYDQVLCEMTTYAIHIYSIAFLMAGFNIFASAFFTALNNGIISALISFMRTLVFQVIFILILPKFFGLDGIWYSIIVAEVLSVTLSFVMLFVKNKQYGYLPSREKIKD